MAKEKRPSWWKMFSHQRAVIEAASPEDAGDGLKAAFRYFDGEEVTSEELSREAFFVFSVIRPYIDESFQDYERRVENGSKGGRPPKEKP